MKTFRHLVNLPSPIPVIILGAMARRKQREIRGEDQAKDKKVEVEMRVLEKGAVEEKREAEKEGSDLL